MLRIAKTLPRFLLLLTLMCFTGCYPALIKPAQRPDEALSRVRFFYPSFRDDMQIESLVLALERNLEYLHRLDPERIFNYGPDKFTCRQVLESQEALLKLIKENPDPDKLNKEVRKQFRLYRATGRVGNSKVLFTGYFEPIFDGSLTPDETFKYPIYRQPDDLVKIDMSLFSKKFKGQSIVARIEGNKVIPYYSRRNIEMEKALRGRNLEIAWLKDPVDVAFLHIQGSGRLSLPDGKSTLVGYKASNGHPYRSIGRYLLDMGFMNREQMSMQGIRKYLAENPDMINRVLDHNPSYVFFHVLNSGPLGSINVPVTPGRSLALDARLFPKGALAFMKCRKPVVNDQGEITKWKEFSRFVLNQDTGGAIKGAGRADLFWGIGPYAETAAGHMQHDGMLYILIKKP
ncbi:MAG: MltA domain-containing protein [Deltaproteobacteria bacterium]|nr:MltA domain-containing protein [Deltaproteobacteria bacterium]